MEFGLNKMKIDYKDVAQFPKNYEVMNYQYLLIQIGVRKTHLNLFRMKLEQSQWRNYDPFKDFTSQEWGVLNIGAFTEKREEVEAHVWPK